MIITNCPRCGAMNATTTCNKCGWSQFNKSTVSTGVLLDDYKRLLLENKNLKERVAELEAWINKFIAEGEYLSLLNGLVNGDSDWGNLVADYWKEREE